MATEVAWASAKQPGDKYHIRRHKKGEGMNEHKTSVVLGSQSGEAFNGYMRARLGSSKYIPPLPPPSIRYRDNQIPRPCANPPPSIPPHPRGELSPNDSSPTPGGDRHHTTVT